MLVECSYCGAPLDVQTGARVVACAYCNRQHKVPRMKTLAPDTPSDWKPPRVWTPPETARARSRPLRFHPVKIVAGLVVTASRLFAAAFSFVALLPALYFAHQGLRGSAAASGAVQPLGELASRFLGREQVEGVAQALEGIGEGVLPGAGWNGEEPYRCSGVSRATLSGVTARLPGRTAVTAEGNCELRLVDCTIEAWDGVAIAHNARVVIERSRIDAKSVAVDVRNNGKLELVESSLQGGEIGVRGEHNAELILGSGRVAGKQHALVAKHNARGELREATLEGKVQARKGRIEGL